MRYCDGRSPAWRCHIRFSRQRHVVSGARVWRLNAMSAFALEHDPEKWNQFSDHMLNQKSQDQSLTQQESDAEDRVRQR
jgi:hypothetical protein